jgi:hypothetical protein
MASYQSRDRLASPSTKRSRIGRTTVSSRISTSGLTRRFVHLNRIRWCPALRSNEDVAIGVLNALKSSSVLDLHSFSRA